MKHVQHKNKNKNLYRIASIASIMLGILLLLPIDFLFIPPELPKIIFAIPLITSGFLSTVGLRWARTILLFVSVGMLPFAVYSFFMFFVLIYMATGETGFFITPQLSLLVIASVGFIGIFTILTRQAYIDYRRKQ